MRTRIIFFALAIAVVAGVAVAMNRPDVPLLGTADGCTAKVESVSASLDPAQARNAALMAAVGLERGLPARAVSIAIATSMQESKLRNLSSGDRDSLGLFQQRPSQGWGTRAQIHNPYYSTNAFFDVLAKVQGFSSMPITEAAQQVQRSAYPDAYAQHESEARAIASALTGYSQGGQFSCVVRSTPSGGTFDHVAHNLTRGYGTALHIAHGARQDALVHVGSGSSARRLGWSVAYYLVAWAQPLGIHEVRYDGHVWTAGSASSKGWRPAGAGRTDVQVSLG